MKPIILETSGLTKQFRGFVAVKDVDLKIRRGTIHALIGPNGAGKSTVFNLLTKFLTPSAGSIRRTSTGTSRVEEDMACLVSFARQERWPRGLIQSLRTFLADLGVAAESESEE